MPVSTKAATPFTPASALAGVVVWDLPTRLFHWLMVIAVSTSIATALAGGSWMPVHAGSGLAICALLVFRLVWGFVGNFHARFQSFFPTLQRLRAYLRGQWRGQGHNPVGALSVFVLLGLLALQVATGLPGTDEISFSGPLAPLVSESVSTWLTAQHHRVAYALYGFLALHVLAVLFHARVRGNNLVTPMITGRKLVPAGVADAPPQQGKPIALVLALALALGALYLASGWWIL
jgi:cytochrome b